MPIISQLYSDYIAIICLQFYTTVYLSSIRGLRDTFVQPSIISIDVHQFTHKQYIYINV